MHPPNGPGVSCQPQVLPVVVSLTAVSVAAVAVFVCVDILPQFGFDIATSYGVMAFLEGILFMQVVGAWALTRRSLSLDWILLFALLFFFRLVFRAQNEMTSMWCLRVSQVYSPRLGFLWYAIGIVGLHPSVMRWLRGRFNRRIPLTRVQSVILTAICGALLSALFWGLRSTNMSQDGADWVLRTREPVWYLYMREPLTIGLYRAVYLALQPVGSVASRTVIALISVVSGVWSLFWFDRLFREAFRDGFSVFVGWLTIAASGGTLLLFLGHIEVYPVFIAGLAPSLYTARGYMAGERSIAVVGLCFSVLFLLHLSAAWLLPGFLLLPFLRCERRNPWKDLAIFVGLFAVVQLSFWGLLLQTCYGGNLRWMSARMHETFFVGLDRAMFLPATAILHPRHISDLLNEYFYLSPTVAFLLPFALLLLVRERQRASLFWLLLFAGYFSYTICWNPDRGFPEDWDLFSPLVPLALLVPLQLLSNRERGCEEIQPTKGQLSFRWMSDREGFRDVIYLTAVGALPYVCTQVWYHHTVLFSRV